MRAKTLARCHCTIAGDEAVVRFKRANYGPNFPPFNGEVRGVRCEGPDQRRWQFTRERECGPVPPCEQFCEGVSERGRRQAVHRELPLLLVPLSQ